MKFRLNICLVFLVAFNFVKADVYTVTNNQDSGVGSLRQAITDANSHTGADKITFNITGTDVASRTITLESGLPILTGATIIDGTTQPTGNPFGISYAKIQLAAAVSGSSTCLTFLSDSCEIYGLFIHKFQTGVAVEGAYAKIGAIQKGNVIYNCSNAAISLLSTDHAGLQGNLVGVDTAGIALTGVTGDGVKIMNSFLVSIGGKTLLAKNIISGNNRGVYIENSAFVDVNSNYIGVGTTGLAAQPNQYGVYGAGINNNIEIGGDSLYEVNLISGNINAGVYGILSNSSIQGNMIGLNLLGDALGNGTYGIYFTFGSSDNVIGGDLFKENIIAHNGSEAIAFQNATCQRNTITKNRMYCNSKISGSGGIKLNNANTSLAAPQLTIVTSAGLGGITIPNGTVEIFTNDSCVWCEGSTYIGTATANANGVFAYSGTVSGSVTATVTDSEGNTSAFSVCADSSAQACIVAGFSSSGFLCLNEPISFIDQSVTEPASNLSSWSWEFGDGGTSTEPSPAHAFTTSGTFNVQLIATNSNGCADTVVHQVVINELPVAAFDVLPLSCVNTVVHFADQSTTTTGIITQRSWTFGDGGTSGAENPAHTYTSPGIYSVNLKVTNTFGCTDDQTTNIVIAPKASASFTSSATGLIVNFTNTSSFNGPHSSAWDFGDGNTSTLDNTINAYSNSGTYIVCLTIYDSLCDNESTFCDTLDIATGINDPASAVSIHVYPNPASDQLTISCGNVAIKTIRLSSIIGENVVAIMNEVSQKGFINLSLPPLTSGIYLLYLETDKGMVTKKIVVD
ncbi:MAG TPA: PKD domain-containing protein [Chitinophagales bacterium]|nr:PKD domain-containing protein [Chitinophagales bacterium]